MTNLSYLFCYLTNHKYQNFIKYCLRDTNYVLSLYITLHSEYIYIETNCLKKINGNL